MQYCAGHTYHRGTVRHKLHHLTEDCPGRSLLDPIRDAELTWFDAAIGFALLLSGVSVVGNLLT